MQVWTLILNCSQLLAILKEGRPLIAVAVFLVGGRGNLLINIEVGFQRKKKKVGGKCEFLWGTLGGDGGGQASLLAHNVQRIGFIKESKNSHM